MSTTFILKNKTGLSSKSADTWVAGWINGGPDLHVLDDKGSFAVPKHSEVPFIRLSDTLSVSLPGATNGNDRFIFVVSKNQPAALIASQGLPVQFTAYPYAHRPGVAAPGPYDIFEFGANAADDLSGVNGFGLNLYFSVTVGGTEYQYGANPNTMTRLRIGEAFDKFVKAEQNHHPPSSAFSELLYQSPIGNHAPPPPLVDGQFFAICDPNDMLVAKTDNYQRSSGDPLESFWDATLTQFFTNNYWLSINLSSNPKQPNIYSGQCTQQTNPDTKVSCPAYTLSNGTDCHVFYMPLSKASGPAGLSGAQYVFQQAFNHLTPAGPQGDAGLLQDSIWEAICRGVSTYGVFPQKKSNGESTTSWNNSGDWYQEGIASHVYAKFLHYSTIEGSDSRPDGTPIFVGDAAYGFSMDENPLGPYTGANVPSKTPVNVPDGATVTVTVGPWK